MGIAQPVGALFVPFRVPRRLAQYVQRAEDASVVAVPVANGLLAAVRRRRSALAFSVRW